MSELQTKDSIKQTNDFIRAATLEELKAAGMIVVRGARCPLVVVYDDGKVFALDNRCPHLGFPLQGSHEPDCLFIDIGCLHVSYRAEQVMVASAGVSSIRPNRASRRG